MDYRIEEDTLGEVKVPVDKLWGAQTQRSLENFRVGKEKMPIEVIYSLALIKKASAIVNLNLKLISKDISELIVYAADRVLAGGYDDQFPLNVWQTGSGTQTNMNVNEVISNIANINAGTKPGAKHPVHPNDHVNRSQSSNDVVPSAISIAIVKMVHESLLPNLKIFREALKQKSEEFNSIVKCGRTHLMDATPLTLGQEFSAYVAQIDHAVTHIKNALPQASQLALGGTAVGTGLNSHPKYAEKVAKQISKLTDIDFVTAPCKFEALSSMDGLVALSSALRSVAIAYMKIAEDIRLLGSGPRCGIGELILPANEPGSSIMPGKVNPTQCESMTQVAVQVMANDVAVGFAGSQGHLQLNVYRPVLAANIIQSLHILADSAVNFTDRCLRGIKPNIKNIEKHLNHSLMLVTALNPHIGYENSAKIAKKAHDEHKTLKEAALELGLVTAEEFDKWVNPKNMTHP